jgi:hypothetical protein
MFFIEIRPPQRPAAPRTLSGNPHTKLMAGASTGTLSQNRAQTVTDTLERTPISGQTHVLAGLGKGGGIYLGEHAAALLNDMKNLLPRDGSDSNDSSPPSSVTISREITRPSPRPFFLVVKNGAKID